MKGILNHLICLSIFCLGCRSNGRDENLRSLRGIWCDKAYIDTLLHYRSLSKDDWISSYIKIFPEYDSVSHYLGPDPSMMLASPRIMTVTDTSFIVHHISNPNRFAIYLHSPGDSVVIPVGFSNHPLIKISDDPYSDLQSYINRQFIAGRYLLDSHSDQDTVQFTPTGFIQGIKEYQKYYLVTSYKLFSDPVSDGARPFKCCIYDAIILEDTISGDYLWLAFETKMGRIRMFEPYGDQIEYFPKSMFNLLSDEELLALREKDLGFLKMHPHSKIQEAKYLSGGRPDDLIVRYAIVIRQPHPSVRLDSTTLVYSLKSVDSFKQHY